MGEIVLGRFRPDPGTSPGDLQIPGPGLYEADFSIPAFLLPDGVIAKQVSVNLSGNRVSHIRSTVKGDNLTVRFQVERDETANVAGIVPLVGALTIGTVARAVGGLIFGSLAAYIMKQIVEALRELRKLGPASSLTVLLVAATGALLAFKRG